MKRQVGMERVVVVPPEVLTIKPDKHMFEIVLKEIAEYISST